VSPISIPKLKSVPTFSNVLSTRNEMSGMHDAHGRLDSKMMHAAVGSHMSGSCTNTHSKRMIKPLRTMDTLQTMDCRMNTEGIVTCEPRVPSPEANSSMHEKWNMVEKYMGLKDKNGQNNAMDAEATMYAGNARNTESSMHVRRIVNNKNAVSSNAMMGDDGSNALDAESTRINDRTTSRDH
jgi:hypothetical protein